MQCADAIEVYQEDKEYGQPYDAVIVDIVVPGGMGGEETIQKLAEIDPEVKAVAGSGYSNNPIMADFRKYGFSDAIAKPYEIGELSEVLHRVIMGAIE
jgi:DNA-binding NtrC family response regulator